MSNAFSNLSSAKEELDKPRANKCALKLLGIDNIIYSDEEVLECLTHHISPSAISALIFDAFNNFYIVFLLDIESACTIVNRTINIGDHKVTILPLLDFFIIDGVHPTLTKEDVADIFRTFGNVYDIKNYKVSPNSSTFPHVLSGRRKISFFLPGEEVDVSLPKNVVCLPYSFQATKLCCACLTEGHSMISCPDIDDSIHFPKTVSNARSEEEGTSPFKEESFGEAQSSSCKVKNDVEENQPESLDNSFECFEDELPENESFNLSTSKTDGDSFNLEDIKDELDIQNIIKTSTGILSSKAIQNLLNMDGRNKKLIKIYILKYTKDMYAVYKQIREITLVCLQHESVLLSDRQRQINKMVLLMSTVLKICKSQTKSYL